MKQRAKSEETRALILDTALDLFRKKGFEETTMRDIAAAAGVALGAAYYYYDSKHAIVMAFYERSQRELEPETRLRLTANTSLEKCLRSLIELKFEYFLPNRELLGALAAHADPDHPLSPFSTKTKEIRDQEIRYFAEALESSKQKVTPDLKPYLPRLLWLYQMGLIMFWVYDRSKKQGRTEILFEKSLQIITGLIRISSLPLLKPVRKPVIELLEAIYAT